LLCQGRVATWGPFHQHSCAAFSRALFGAQIWRNGKQRLANLSPQFFWQTVQKFGSYFVGEIEGQIFRRMLCAGNSSLGNKSLLKSTPCL